MSAPPGSQTGQWRGAQGGARPPGALSKRTAPFRSLLVALTGASLAASCHRIPPAPTTANAPANQSWSWTSYPLSPSLLLAQLPGVLSAPRSEVLRSPAAGRLRLLPSATSGQTLAAGTRWAEIQPENAAEDDRATARAEQELTDRREQFRRKELPAELQRLDSEITAAKETLSLAQFAEKSPELFRGDSPALDPRLRPHLTSVQAQAELDRLTERRRGLAEHDPSFEPAELQAMATALQRSRDARAEVRARLALTLPFAGQLRLARSAEASAVRIEAGEILAQVEDPSVIEIKIRANLPLLHAVSAASLSCRVAIPGGSEVTGTFSSWGIEAGSTGEEPVLRFRIRSDALPNPDGRLLGVALPVLVYTALPQAARIVPKLDVAAADSAGALDAGWRQGIARLFPGSTFLAEGRAAVALLPPP